MNSDRLDVHISLMSGPRDGDILIFGAPATDDELVLTIGRREGCNIVLSYDTQVSRLHARLIYDARDTEFYLEDVESRNGTFIGQEKVNGRLPLEVGTLFRIGRTWMRLDPPANSPPSNPTMD